MKFKNLIQLPFMIVADIVSLGNMGDRSFTQQLVDQDEVERLIELKRVNEKSKR